MSFTLRPATAADLPAIDRVYREGFTATFAHLYSTEDFNAFLDQVTPAAWRAEYEDPGYAFHVAESDGAVAGFAKLGPSALPHAPPGRSIELRQLYILKAWHGTGVGVALMDWTIAEARRRGADHLNLSVFVDNTRARRFYDRYGFIFRGPYAFMVGNHADEDLVMSLKL